MFKRIVSCVLVCSLIMLSFCSCSSKQKEQAGGTELQKFTKTYVEYFDTVCTVVAYTEDQATFDSMVEGVEQQLSEYNKLYDIYKSYQDVNNICTINKNAGIKPVKVDTRIIDLLEFAGEMYEITDGKVNIAMGSVLSIWHDYRTAGIDDPENAQLPPMEMLQEAAEHTDIGDVIIDKNSSTVYLADPDMSLDVGAVAKGYATEKIAQDLTDKGYKNVALNFGGNIRTIGTKGDGSNWKAAVTDPDPNSETGYLFNVQFSSMSFVTSGSYERYYTVNGTQYHHIIDPATLMPNNEFTSVSIYAPDSGIADVLSTAVFNMSLQDGRSLIESLGNVEAMWVTADYEIYYSSGFEAIKTE